MSGPLREYEVEVNGHTTTLLLSADDAKARGLADEKKAPAPANKARSAKNKG